MQGFDSESRKTCQLFAIFRARRYSKSRNPPREAQNAARRLANSENLPARGRLSTGTQKTCRLEGDCLQELRKPADSRAVACSNPENLPALVRPSTETRKTCPPEFDRLRKLGKPASSKAAICRNPENLPAWTSPAAEIRVAAAFGPLVRPFKSYRELARCRR